MSRPLRRTRADLAACAAITVVAAALAGAAYFTAPIRSAELTPAAEQWAGAASLSTPPSLLTESFRLPDSSPGIAPLVVHGAIVTYADHTVTATTPQGETLWTYRRDEELCTLSAAWGKVVATYRGPAGCGDVVAIEADSGQYAGTRSATAPGHVAELASNDRVGYSSAERVELWRSDLVRTVEYGHVEAPQESGAQPNPGCTITSALTRKELLAVTETCGEDTWLRLMRTTPEDSRVPEIQAEDRLEPGSFLVAVSPEAAAVYDPSTGEVTSYRAGGTHSAAGRAPNLAPGGVTADLPHHMSYFSGGQLVLFEPDSLAVARTFADAIGPGAAAGEKLLYPTDQGISVADWNTGAVERVIGDQRSGAPAGPVGVAVAGDAIVEKRGGQAVVLAER